MSLQGRGQISKTSACRTRSIGCTRREATFMVRKNFHSFLLFVFSLALFGFASATSGQLVADGATNTIDGYSTNLIGDLTVGTNGSFTRLQIVDGGMVTNSGHGYIGQN